MLQLHHETHADMAHQSVMRLLLHEGIGGDNHHHILMRQEEPLQIYEYTDSLHEIYRHLLQVQFQNNLRLG